MSHLFKTLATSLTVPFVPTDLGGKLWAWLKTPIPGGVNGVDIATWPDSSGNGRDLTLTVGAGTATYYTSVRNGRDIVRFTLGYGHFSVATDLTAGASFYIASKANATGFVHGFVVDINAGHMSFAISEPTLFISDLGFAHAATRDATGFTNWHTYSASFDTSTLVVGKDGADGTPGDATGITLYAGDAMYIGHSGGHEEFADEGEVIICTPRLTPTEDGQIKAYLNSRWL